MDNTTIILFQGKVQHSFRAAILDTAREWNFPNYDSAVSADIHAGKKTLLKDDSLQNINDGSWTVFVTVVEAHTIQTLVSDIATLSST